MTAVLIGLWLPSEVVEAEKIVESVRELVYDPAMKGLVQFQETGLCEVAKR